MLDDEEVEDRPTFPDDPSVQHGHLARLLVRLKDASATAEPRDVCQLLDVLIADVRQHFAAEEHGMERAAYPMLEEHRERHEKFVRHLEAVRLECESRAGGVGTPIAKQLENWFHDHEQTADAELLAFLGKAL